MHQLWSPARRDGFDQRVADTKLDIACISGSKISVYSHDNQFAWSINLGRRIKACYPGDISGNNKSDLECKLSGTKKIARVGGDGALMTNEADDTTVDPAAPPFEMFADVGQVFVNLFAVFVVDADDRRLRQTRQFGGRYACGHDPRGARDCA